MRRPILFVLIALSIFAAVSAEAQYSGCDRVIKADVVAIDQPYFINRLGAAMAEGMMFALKRDVVPSDTTKPLGPGNAVLRPDKRPRPMVLRANVGDCLAITFTNLLLNTPVPGTTQPATRQASFHAAGMELVGSINDDGSFVGANPNALAPAVAPGNTKTYVIRATKEGPYLANTMGAVTAGENLPDDGAQQTAGLFGAVNVQPRGSFWYRSQVTAKELSAASPGVTPLNQPKIDYEAKSGGVPVLRMLDDNNEIIYTDLTAIITGDPKNGYLFKDDGQPQFFKNPAEPDRLQPYREFTIEYHELSDAVQAFPIFGKNVKSGQPKSTLGSRTLQAGGDAFAINYGTGAIGAEILGNRLGVGPMGSCADCAFEEFFLSAWTVGDPAMVVDVPANVPCAGVTNQGDVTAGKSSLNNQTLAPVPCVVGVVGNAPAGVTPYRKAHKTLYPDDPSNVYHSYINDRVKFRIIHAGTGVSHVHHQHAHQWIHSPNNDTSTYLDSQLISPGSAYTLEIDYNGGGNRNKTVGDSIFHCHFYPHFAAGMWSLWRTHDVYEAGTELDGNGIPVAGARALPDPEIPEGSPIPGLIPMPAIAMPPMPGWVKIVAVPDPNGGSSPIGYRADSDPNVNPGYPFFIPGVAGARSPHPPLDFANEGGKELNGGLFRHIILNAKVTEHHTAFDFTKEMDFINAYRLPEDGTPSEKVAMKYHSVCFHPSFFPDGAPAKPGYRTNGLPPASGAPYADPGLVPWNPDNPPPPADQCQPIDPKDWIRYKAAVVQTDFVFNKKGWHYPQSRLLTLWQDVVPTVSGDRPPEPFFFRANSGQGVEYWHTNLVPKIYNLDNFQVRTPTDVIGQHIHLVKFDVTSSDGAGNGWNYEDGTFSPEEVVSRINGINKCGGLAADGSTINKCNSGGPARLTLTAEPPPAEICTGSNCQPDWTGAQTTVQRWFADPLIDNKGDDRTIRSVFTHDHFSPSTHQQAGLYAALLVEPEHSTWRQGETGAPMHTRTDGGPTSWNAVISTKGKPDTPQWNFREFAIGLQDFQLAYAAGSRTTASSPPYNPNSQNSGWTDPNVIEQPSFGMPQLISAGPTNGTLSFNYRNEPLPFRLVGQTNANLYTNDAQCGTAPFIAPGSGAKDPAHVFLSNITRADPAINQQPTPGSLICPNHTQGFIFPKKPLTADMQPGDPFTPLLRAYEGDNVQVRLIAGAHMLPHDFAIFGTNWLFEPANGDDHGSSGFRNNQAIGISEHYEFLFRVPRASPSTDYAHNATDYLYTPDYANAAHGIIDGMWGIMRAYKGNRADLVTTATNPVIKPVPPPANAEKGYSCPPNAPERRYYVNATSPTQIVINSRGSGMTGDANPIVNKFPLQYVMKDNPYATEPLILRANAGECVGVTLYNNFKTTANVFNSAGASSKPLFQPQITLTASTQASLTPTLLAFDAMKNAGINVGFNPSQTISAGASRTYWWYAGRTSIDENGKISGEPVEFGSANLIPADPLEQDNHGLVGGLVIEPKNAVACPDVMNPGSGPYATHTYASANVYGGGDCKNPGPFLFREFVLVTQDDIGVVWPPCTSNPCKTNNSTGGGSDDRTAQVMLNYKAEPVGYRLNNTINPVDFDNFRVLSNSQVGGDPQTPVFFAAAGKPFRMRLTHPRGSGDQQILTLHGHVWQEEPYSHDSTSIVGDTSAENPMSQHIGSRDAYGVNSSYDIVQASAGGKTKVTGDYIYRTIPGSFMFTSGLWGLVRVGDPGKDTVSCSPRYYNGALYIHGTTGVYLGEGSDAKNGTLASTVDVYYAKSNDSDEPGTKIGTATVGTGGRWSIPANKTAMPAITRIVAVSPNGGYAAVSIEKVTAPTKVSRKITTSTDTRFKDPLRPSATIEAPKEKTVDGNLPAPPSNDDNKKQ